MRLGVSRALVGPYETLRSALVRSVWDDVGLELNSVVRPLRAMQYMFQDHNLSIPGIACGFALTGFVYQFYHVVTVENEVEGKECPQQKGGGETVETKQQLQGMKEGPAHGNHMINAGFPAETNLRLMNERDLIVSKLHRTLGPETIVLARAILGWGNEQGRSRVSCA